MRLVVNGEARDFAAADISELLTSLGLPPAAVLVEHNGLALRREEWTGHPLRDGDRLEIVRIVAGG